MLVEVLDLIQGSIIARLAVCRGLDYLGVGEATLGVPGGEVVDALQDQEWQQYKAIAAYILNRCRPFPVARLKLLALATSFSTRNNHASIDNTHYKACLVEVVEVVVLDAVLCTHVSY